MNEILLMVAIVFGTDGDPQLTQEVLWELDSIDMYDATDQRMLIQSMPGHWSGSEDYRWGWRKPKSACEMEYQP